MLGRDARPGVAHGQLQAGRGGGRGGRLVPAQGYFAARRREAQGVAEQVGEHGLQLGRVEHERQPAGALGAEADALRLGQRGEAGRQLPGEHGHVAAGGGQAHGPGVELAQVEELVDEAQQASGVAQNQTATAAGGRVGRIVLQLLGRPQN